MRWDWTIWNLHLEVGKLEIRLLLMDDLNRFVLCLHNKWSVHG